MAKQGNQRKLELFDDLTLIKKYDTMSKWQGSESLYLFKHLPDSDKLKMPVAQCYKDRHYFTGIFRTKNPLKFSGDLGKGKDRKQLLLFVFESKDKLKIFKSMNK